jgi:hypothetical protein
VRASLLERTLTVAATRLSLSRSAGEGLC